MIGAIGVCPLAMCSCGRGTSGVPIQAAVRARRRARRYRSRRAGFSSSKCPGKNRQNPAGPRGIPRGLHVPALDKGVRELEITNCDLQTWCPDGTAPPAPSMRMLG